MVPMDPRPRCLYVGDVPHHLCDELQLLDWMRSQGLPVPSRCLIRASTGTVHGFFAIMHFPTAELAASLLSHGRVEWPDGTTSPLRPCATCVLV